MDLLLPGPASISNAVIIYALDFEVHGRKVLRSPPHPGGGASLSGGVGGGACLCAQDTQVRLSPVSGKLVKVFTNKILFFLYHPSYSCMKQVSY